MRELHLFAGIGGGILGGMLLGHRCVGAVEIDPYCRRVLEARQRDGILEPFPIHDDIRTFDGTAWRGRADIVCGGFPCQDVSAAGKRVGLAGERSGLWFEMARVIRQVGPRYVFVENVPGLLVRGADRVLGDLADLGFDAEWCVLSAAHVGAPHIRRRLWILAAHPDRQQHEGGASSVGWPTASELPPNPNRSRLHEQHDQQHLAWPKGAATRTRDDGCQGDVANAMCARLEGQRRESSRVRPEHATTGNAGWWQVEPPLGRVADGIPDRVGQLRALGNAQVPQVAATAFQLLMQRFES